MMKLEQFRVKTFRSVMDSGWIDCDDVTTLVGVNEAGKSNLLLALWKLNPAKEGTIDPLRDLPIKLYSSCRENLEEIYFIEADFEIDSALITRIQGFIECIPEQISVVRIRRNYAGKYTVGFPNFSMTTTVNSEAVKISIESASEQILTLNEKNKTENGIKEKTIEALSQIQKYLSDRDKINRDDIKKLFDLLDIKVKKTQSSEIYPFIEGTKDDIKKRTSKLFMDAPSSNPDVRELVISEIPSFVYYSNYGNLDSQIYLPHAIEKLQGKGVSGSNEEAKVRTLRVLFDFVKLNPKEILDLGKDPIQIVLDNHGREQKRQPTQEEIENASKQKTQRSILLQSASTDLTKKFRDWWKQGNYIFRFQADGEYFKIWVSDDKRPEEVELERRSTGLQWFLSFYLIFLVESQEAHKGSILLLDEAGLSLHPLAQKDLTEFFTNLSVDNQIVHTTHSPFLVDTSNIDKVKVVYLDNEGYTVSSGNLRAANDKLNEKSIYAVHAALGLSVSDILLQGCKPIIVEGPSDQHYLSALKIFLVKEKVIAPMEELVFIPSGGVRGVQGVSGLVSAKEDKLPIVLLDSDGSGQSAKKKLISGLYQQQPNEIVEVGDYLELDNGEIEDFFPTFLMIKQLNRFFKEVEDEDIEEVLNNKTSIVEQIEKFATINHIDLPNGWKVDLAKSVKAQLLKKTTEHIPPEYIAKWKKLFETLCSL